MGVHETWVDAVTNACYQAWESMLLILVLSICYHVVPTALYEHITPRQPCLIGASKAGQYESCSM
jgi:hypothetical protein